MIVASPAGSMRRGHRSVWVAGAPSNADRPPDRMSPTGFDRRLHRARGRPQALTPRRGRAKNRPAKRRRRPCPAPRASPAARPGARNRPPFRADHVGSLLRPPELQEARAAWKAGTLAPEALRAVEDRCIAAAIRKQEELGLRAATDGEYRRAYWHYDFVVRAGWRGAVRAGAEDPVQGQRGAAAHAAGQRQDRLVEAGDAGPLPVRRRPRDHGGAEDDHPVAQRGAFPRRAAGDRCEDLSGPGRVLRRSGRGLPEGGGGVRRRGLPLSAAGRGEHRLSVRPGADRRR